MEQSGNSTNEKLFKWVKRIAAIFFFLIAIGFLFEKGVLAAIPNFIIALLLIPSLRAFWIRNIPFIDRRPVKFGLILALLAVSGSLLPKDDLTNGANSKEAAAKVQADTAPIQTKAGVPDTLKSASNKGAQKIDTDAEFNRKWEQLDSENMARANNIKQQTAKFEEACLSSWDGSCPALVDYVKQHMNDPDSFEHVETRCANKGNYAIVVMSFRGKNGFGAEVISSIRAKVSWECKVLEILE